MINHLQTLRQRVEVMDALPSRKREWVLTQAAFDALLSLLDADDRERAAEQYERLRRKLEKFFEWRDAENPSAEADETLNRVARKAIEGESIRDLNNYCLGVARLLLKESFKQKARQQRARAQFPQPSRAEPFFDEADARLECFETCLQQLTAENRELIMAYYQDEKRTHIEQRKELATALGIPLNALRIRAHRIRAQLEECVRECLARQTGS
ncbi:MAG: hypothetical protein H0T45_15455 [Pyrinomonadaceae bacterium]|nr:hypothetical protein [Pyrinomonadaceae bacterium]